MLGRITKQTSEASSSSSEGRRISLRAWLWAASKLLRTADEQLHVLPQNKEVAEIQKDEKLQADWVNPIKIDMLSQLIDKSCNIQVNLQRFLHDCQCSTITHDALVANNREETIGTHWVQWLADKDVGWSPLVSLLNLGFWLDMTPQNVFPLNRTTVDSITFWNLVLPSQMTCKHSHFVFHSEYYSPSALLRSSEDEKGGTKGAAVDSNTTGGTVKIEVVACKYCGSQWSLVEYPHCTWYKPLPKHLADQLGITLPQPATDHTQPPPLVVAVSQAKGVTVSSPSPNKQGGGIGGDDGLATHTCLSCGMKGHFSYECPVGPPSRHRCKHYSHSRSLNPSPQRTPQTQHQTTSQNQVQAQTHTTPTTTTPPLTTPTVMQNQTTPQPNPTPEEAGAPQSTTAIVTPQPVTTPMKQQGVQVNFNTPSKTALPTMWQEAINGGMQPPQGVKTQVVASTQTEG
eukprot:TRINITY_DN87610_c0_g1_i1.p1 TRINITY_DN87610_c0_g1~~TRINITY_DN87610_c0_g1_i1.p1  ORF type:complete len:537 (+),score=56.40 TRINITY_DN87610_c0_g1_i1:242-1612(+)